MPHRIYHTDAIVLASASRGEADRVYELYTRELGAVRAEARSVRREASRLRYTLQLFARVEVDLVRAKRGWRITSARLVEAHRSAWDDPRRRAVLAGIARLVRRLVQGEGADPALYDVLLREIALLIRTPSDGASLAPRECAALARILGALGYWDASGRFGYLVDPSITDEDAMLRIRVDRRELVAAINGVLHETQL